MNTLNLPLFSTLDTSTITTPVSINQEEHVTNKQNPSDIFDPLKNAFKEIYQQTPEENTVIKMRRILGEKAKDMSDEQVQCMATEFQFLIDNWLDEFEKDLFNGMTLKEVLNEK